MRFICCLSYSLEYSSRYTHADPLQSYLAGQRGAAIRVQEVQLPQAAPPLPGLLLTRSVAPVAAHPLGEVPIFVVVAVADDDGIQPERQRDSWLSAELRPGLGGRGGLHCGKVGLAEDTRLCRGVPLNLRVMLDPADPSALIGALTRRVLRSPPTDAQQDFL